MVFYCLACAATQRPVLGPSENLPGVTADAVQRDIDECIRMAKEAGRGAVWGKQVARQTAGSAAVGAASGAVAGALYGSAGRGAAAGAAGGAAAGLLSSLLRSNKLDGGQQQYVEDCLRQKGYNPTGWR
jgi:outer membrane lipoprotein SlyB